MTIDDYTIFVFSVFFYTWLVIRWIIMYVITKKIYNLIINKLI